MQNKEQIIKLLTQTGIPYTLVEHSAVYTIEEMLVLHLPHFETVAKNLFVRDAKSATTIFWSPRTTNRSI